MLRGEKVGLRARIGADIPILQAELHDDVPTRSRSSGRPWVPVSPGSRSSSYSIEDDVEDRVSFSVVRLADGELVGDALLWGIDTHNRVAHLGLSLRPAMRGSGLSVDIVQVLCHYGFVVRGLQRLQLETLADNAAMIRAATRVGFVHEGTLRRAAWVYGQFVDEVVLGLLASEFFTAAR